MKKKNFFIIQENTRIIFPFPFPSLSKNQEFPFLFFFLFDSIFSNRLWKSIIIPLICFYPWSSSLAFYHLVSVLLLNSRNQRYPFLLNPLFLFFMAWDCFVNLSFFFAEKGIEIRWEIVLFARKWSIWIGNCRFSTFVHFSNHWKLVDLQRMLLFKRGPSKHLQA